MTDPPSPTDRLADIEALCDALAHAAADYQSECGDGGGLPEYQAACNAKAAIVSHVRALQAENDRLRKERLTPEEARAVTQFFSYGATRGNHAGPDGTGPTPGPLTPYISAMGSASRKLWDLAATSDCL